MTTAMILWFGAADLALLGLLEWLEYLRRIRDRHMLERRLEDLVTFDNKYDPPWRDQKISPAHSDRLAIRQDSGDFEECS